MDKKKKILSLVAVVLVGGLAALSATGGVSNLRSSFWVDTGEGNGYWDYSDENTSPSILPPTQLSPSQEVARLEQTIKDLEKEKGDLEKDTPSLKQKLTDAEGAVNSRVASRDKLIANLDLYACTKNAAYKNKGYKYDSVAAIDARYSQINGMISTKATDTQSLPNVIKNKQSELANVTAEKTAITASLAKCVTPFRKAPKTIDLYACTKNKAYQNKNYVYASPNAVDDRLKTINAMISTKATDTQSLPNVIKNKQVELANVTTERKAIIDSNTKCIAGARAQIPALQKLIDDYTPALAAAQKNLTANTDAIAAKIAAIDTAKSQLSTAQQVLKEAQNASNNNNGGSGNNGGNNGGNGNNAACNNDGICSGIETITSCSSDCDPNNPKNANKQAYCGNGVVEKVYQTDAHGNLTNELVPADTFQQEQCDDGNTVGGDGCSSDCTIESPEVPKNPCEGKEVPKSTCESKNDLVFWTLEDNYRGECKTIKHEQKCDTTYNTNGTEYGRVPYATTCIQHSAGAYCQVDAKVCGDGILQDGEQCDEGSGGNLDDNQGCSSTCTIELHLPDDGTVPGQ